MNPSPQQQAIYDHILSGCGHLLVNAKAGTGKTFTLSNAARLVLQANPNASILFLAFNKSIQEEASKKLPREVEVRTCHSKGLQTIRRLHSATVDMDKTRKVVNALAEKDNWQHETAKQEYVEKIKRICQLADKMRMVLSRDVNAIAERFSIDIEPGEDKIVTDVVQQVSNDYQSVDMVDMIYRPAVYNQYIPQTYDFVFVDECQDLSTAQQKLVVKMCKPGGMMVFVGDPGQAIYGFAGADAASFNNLRALPGIAELPLSKSFRCGKEIIKFANKYNSEIEAFETNGEGSVNLKATLSELQEGDMVLCRVTMPLVSLTYKLIGEGKKAYVRGRDVGEGIVSFLAKSRMHNLQMLDVWMQQQLYKMKEKLRRLHPHISEDELSDKSSYVALSEQIAIIRVIIANNTDVNSVQAIISKLRAIFTDNDGEGIALSTIHKAKGLEADKVFILEWEKIPHKSAKKDWELMQETNLQYVAITRAKKYLGFITDFKADEENMDNIDDLVKSSVSPFGQKIDELF